MRTHAVVDPQALGGVDDQDLPTADLLPAAAPAHGLDGRLVDRSLAHSATIYPLHPP